MHLTVITCDNCQAEIRNESLAHRVRGYDVCSMCLEGKFVLNYTEIRNWPRWVTTTAVIDALKHYEQIIREKQTKVKVTEVNKHLESELLNLPHHDPTKLMKEVTNLQNRIRRTRVSAA